MDGGQVGNRIILVFSERLMYFVHASHVTQEYIWPQCAAPYPVQVVALNPQPVLSTALGPKLS